MAVNRSEAEIRAALNVACTILDDLNEQLNGEGEITIQEADRVSSEIHFVAETMRILAGKMLGARFRKEHGEV